MSEQLLLVLGEDQGDKQDDGEEGDDHQHHVGCRVSSGGCNSLKYTSPIINNTMKVLALCHP